MCLLWLPFVAVSDGDGRAPDHKAGFTMTGISTGKYAGRPLAKSTCTLKKYDAPTDLKDKSISVASLPTASSSSIEREERIIQPKLPSLIATEEEVRQFFVDYTERYNQKDIDIL